MPAENEELDVFRNQRWRPFVNILRGAAGLHDEEVLCEFDRAFVPSIRRAFRVLKAKELIVACIAGDSAEIARLRREHRQQRDRAETFADQIEKSCKCGMTLRQAVDAFVHSCCVRIIDQAALAVVPSDNFPTLEDYRHGSAVWLFRMEGRIAEVVEQIMEDPTKLRATRHSKDGAERRFDQQLGLSLLGNTHED